MTSPAPRGGPSFPRVTCHPARAQHPGPCCPGAQSSGRHESTSSARTPQWWYPTAARNASLRLYSCRRGRDSRQTGSSCETPYKADTRTRTRTTKQQEEVTSNSHQGFDQTRVFFLFLFPEWKATCQLISIVKSVNWQTCSNSPFKRKRKRTQEDSISQLVNQRIEFFEIELRWKLTFSSSVNSSGRLRLTVSFI